MRKYSHTKLFITLLLLLSVQFANAQVIFSENFEGGTFPAAGWTIINGTSGSNWSLSTNPADAVSGSNSITVLQGFSSPSAWIITPGLSLQAGAKYRIRFWYKSSTGSFKRIKLTAGKGSTLNDQVTLINNLAVTNTGYQESDNIFVAPTYDTYHFGFNGTFIWNASAGNLYIDSIVIEKELTPVCSGTPVAGTATASPAYCPGVPVNVSVSGDYSDAGVSLQWYSSPAGANTFTAIPGAFGMVVSNIQTVPTDYRCTVTCLASGLSSVSNIVSVTQPWVCYCTPPASNCALNDFINNVVFSGISNFSICAQLTGYTDYSYTVSPATVNAGDNVPVSVSVGGGGSSYVAVWIDYNQDGVFDASEYKFIGSGTGTVLSNTISIPSNATGGLTRMRVRLQKGSAPAAGSACTAIQLGETEDYSVTINALSSCTGTPVAGTTQSTAASVCTGANFTLSLSGAANNPGITYQWQSSPDNITWTDISGATNTTFIAQQTSSTYYRCKLTCTNSGLFAFSSPVQVSMQICYCTPAVVNCSTYGIDSVGFSNIGNSSGCSANGYGNYTSTVAPAVVLAGTYVPIWVKVNSPSTPKYTAVWIDFNRDGVFSNTEFTDITGTSGVYNTKLVRIPYSALTGITTMRVQSSFTGISSFSNGCGGFSFGETEDYRVDIQPNPSGASAFSFFVNPNAPAGGNGLSWSTAFTSVTEALLNASKKDTIRVAKGTYPAQYTLKDSVIMLGGYPDTGSPTDADRNWGVNRTILTAEAGNPAEYYDNRNNVISGFNLSANTILDGFIIEAAYRTSSSTNGAGIHLSNSSVRMNNCVVRKNYSYNYNPGGTGGSALICSGGSPVFSNCFFVNNNDASYGALQVLQNASAQFINCVFSGNKSDNTIYSNQGTVSLKHCTFFNNVSRINALNETARLPALLADNASTVNVANSIFFNNINTGGAFNNESTSDSTDFVMLGSSVITVIKTITQAYTTGEPLLQSVNPKFRDTSSVAGPDGYYYTADDGLQLVNPCSPAINAGDNPSGASIATDIKGSPRLFGAAVDPGAYEVQSAVTAAPSVLYVKANATGANDGSSWANAFTSLQTAMQYCGDTVKVAAGSYTASVSNKGASFWLENKRVILGGYPNNGNPTDIDRNPTLYPSILTAILPVGGNVKSEVIIRGKNIDSTAVLDGFVISDVNDQITACAAVMITVNASPQIRNTVLKNNWSGAYSGALITRTGSKPLFYNCIFENNGGFSVTSSYSFYGAIYNASGAAPVFRKCIFRNNSTRIENVSPYYGGAMINNNANPVIDSCSFIKNKANNWGGAIANFSSNPVITNTGFYGNYAENLGGDIYNDASSPQVTNCLFADSTMTEYGGSIYNLNQSNPVFTNCQFRNSMAVYQGALVYNDKSSPVFNRCVVTGSKTLYGSGIIYNKNYSQPLFVNCVLANNLQWGPYNLMYSVKSMPAVINSTIVNNKVPGTFTGGVSGLIINTDSTTLTVKNSIFWGNDTRAGVNLPDGDIVDPPGTTTPTIIQNSFTRSTGVNGVNGNFVGIDPKLVDITNPAGPDSIFYTADDGIALCNCSPAVNSGSNAAIAGYSTDFLNNPRIINTTVDIGAAELQSATLTLPKAYYVNAAATGLNNGSSWANAYTSLQKAIQNSCADTIRVAKGTYKPAAFSRDSTFNVNRKLVLWGGYPDNGDPADALRDPVANPTILSGDIGIAGDSTDNSYVVMRINNDDTLVIIDGLTFTRGNGNNNIYNSERGAGINASNNRNLLISNCIFEKNYASNGSALYTSGKIIIDRCLFRQNNSIWGTYFVEGNNALMKNSVFLDNRAQIGGGIFCNTNASFENVALYGNKANWAAGAYLNGNPAAKFTNCNFIRNDASNKLVGVGLYNYNDFTGSPARPVIRNCIFYENKFNGTIATNAYSDWVWANGSNGSYTDPLDIKYSALFTAILSETSNIHSGGILFRDVNNPAGPDGRWFTADDGLQNDRCSLGINNGDNASAAGIVTDITGSPRIKNTVVDMGAYEYQPTTPDYILTNANDSLVANTERTDINGWTHYYQGCQLLLSIKKGTHYIGYVGDGTFRLVVKTTPAYSSGAGTDLTSATYVTPGVNWYVMNRYWKMTPTVQINDSILVRFPFSNTDFNDVRGSNPALTTLQQLVFYTNDSPYNALSIPVPVDKFHPVYNSISANTAQWKYVSNDTINYAEFYVKRLNGGGAGSGTGLNGGPLARISTGCDNAVRTITTPETGSTYQWQVNTGSGYTNIVNDANYSGVNTATLTITNAPTSWYGRKYRCVVNGVPSVYFTVLQFQAVWTGAVDAAWENPLNWNCGKVPDSFTDVIISSGTIVISSNAVINSLQLNPGVNLTIITGNSLTILH